MDKLQAYNQFWNSFGIPAYDQYSVPDEVNGVKVKPPYITYETQSDEFGNTLYLTSSLWYREKTWANITAKEKQIAEFIGRGGVNVAYDQGCFWITKRSPWAQRMNDPDDDMIKRIVLQINVEFLD